MRKKQFRQSTKWLGALIFGFVLVGCSRSVSYEESYAPSSPGYAGESEKIAYDNDSANRVSAEYADDVVEDGAVAGLNDTIAEVATERLIIRNGNLSIVVANTDDFLKFISSLSESQGGWVVSSSTYVGSSSTQAKYGDVTIRVPSENFDQVLTLIKDDALEVSSENVSGQDVTDEYVDINSRLTALRATETRVMNFLDETKNVEEALSVNRELTNLQSQIEVLEGRRKFLQESAAFSSISVTLVPDALNQPIEIGKWRPVGTAKNAIEAVVAISQWLVDVAIWLVIVGLPLLLVFIIVRRGWRWLINGKLGIVPLRERWSKGRAAKRNRTRLTKTDENESDAP